MIVFMPKLILAQIVYEKDFKIYKQQAPFKILVKNNNIYVVGCELGFDSLGKYTEDRFVLKTTLNGDSTYYISHRDTNRSCISDFNIVDTMILGVGLIEMGTTKSTLFLFSDIQKSEKKKINFGGNFGDIFLKILVDENKNLYLIGWYNLTSSPSSAQVYVVKCKLNGDLIWEKWFGGSNAENPNDAIFTNHNTLLISGFTYSFINPLPSGKIYRDGYLLEIDTSGNQLWENNYSTSKSAKIGEAFFSLSGSKFGGYYAAGVLSDDSLKLKDPWYSYEPWIIKVDNVGKLIWQKRFWDANGSTKNKVWIESYIQQIIEANDNELLLIGSYSDTSGRQTNSNIGFICKYNFVCDTIVWRIDFGAFNKNFEAKNFSMLPNGTVYLLLRNYSTDGGDIYLVKIDSMGKMVNECLIHPPSFTSTIAPFPNPFTTEFNLQFAENVSEVNLSMYNAVGQLVVSSTLIPKPTAEGNYYITYQAPSLANGLYFYQLTTNGNLITKGKIMKQ